VRDSSWRFVVAIPALLLAGVALAPLAGSGQTAQRMRLEVLVVKSLDEARKIEAQLRAGADFAQLASEHSIDVNAASGGYLGVVDPETLLPELARAVRGLKPGEVSGIVQIASGYAILKVLRVQENTVADNIVASGPEKSGMLGGSGGTDWRPTIDTSGYGEFLGTLNRVREKTPGFGLDVKEVCMARQQAPRADIASYEKVLAGVNAQTEPHVIRTAHYKLALLHASIGEIDQAIEQWEALYRMPGAQTGEVGQQMEETLGTSYLRRAQMEQGPIPGPVDEAWLVPTHPGAPHPRAGDAQNAISYLTSALKREPGNIELKWLLNLAWMTAGTWPSAVPAESLIPPPVFASKEDLGRFRDVAPAAGVAVYGEAGGVIVDDFDNDGLLDIVESTMEDCDSIHFFHNNGDGTFSDRTAQAGLLNQTGGLNIIQADYNNDGCMDILIMRGGWEFARRRSLLRNNCDGTFTDVTARAGLLEPIRASQAAVWTDIDNDGNLDLFIANENGPAQLFLNKGDGTFIDISREAGVDRIAYAKGVVAADYDNDGYPDLYVTNRSGQGFLYHNNGDRTFTDVTRAAGIRAPKSPFAVLFFDYDNDGWPDLFITSYFPSVEESARSYLGMPIKGQTGKLYRNMGNGTFRDVTAEVGLDRIFMPMGCNFGDIDNSGFLSIYMGMGNPSFAALLPNVLLLNKDGKRFIDVSTSSGTGALAKGHGIAFADLGNNGNEDIFANLGGAEPGDRYASRLFSNPGGHGNNWITLKLVGVKSNRSAIGARITVIVDDADRGHRRIFRTVGSGGSFGASPLEQHIGIGRSARVESIEVWWPASKTHQMFRDLAPNQFLEIREFAAAPVKLNRPSFVFSGAPMRGATDR
jgi:hypothetical protein